MTNADQLWPSNELWKNFWYLECFDWRCIDLYCLFLQRACALICPLGVLISLPRMVMSPVHLVNIINTRIIIIIVIPMFQAFVLLFDTPSKLQDGSHYIMISQMFRWRNWGLGNLQSKEEVELRLNQSPGPTEPVFLVRTVSLGCSIPKVPGQASWPAWSTSLPPACWENCAFMALYAQLQCLLHKPDLIEQSVISRLHALSL